MTRQEALSIERDDFHSKVDKAARLAGVSWVKFWLLPVERRRRYWRLANGRDDFRHV